MQVYCCRSVCNGSVFGKILQSSYRHYQECWDWQINQEGWSAEPYQRLYWSPAPKVQHNHYQTIKASNGVHPNISSPAVVEPVGRKANWSEKDNDWDLSAMNAGYRNWRTIISGWYRSEVGVVFGCGNFGNRWYPGTLPLLRDEGCWYWEVGKVCNRFAEEQQI